MTSQSLRFLFFNVPATTEIYTLSLHDALPILPVMNGWQFREAQTALPDYARIPVVCLSGDRKSTRLNSSHTVISYAVFCLKKKNITLVPVFDELDKLRLSRPRHKPQ